MGSLYASITGTMVLQVKDVPPRPKQYDGQVTIYDHKGSDTSQLKKELAGYGKVLECEAREGGRVHVQFATHEAAQLCVAALLKSDRAVAFVYNSRSCAHTR